MQEFYNFINQVGPIIIIILLSMLVGFTTYLINSIKQIIIAFIERKKPVYNTYNNCHINSDSFPHEDD